MIFKKPFDHLVQKSPPPAQRDRVLREAAKVLEQNQAARKSWLTVFWKPALGVGFAGALAVALAQYLPEKGTKRSEEGTEVAFRHSPEMVRDADMFRDLDTLLKLDGLEKIGKKKWQKKRS